MDSANIKRNARLIFGLFALRIFKYSSKKDVEANQKMNSFVQFLVQHSFIFIIMKALIIGATGSTGKHLVQQLLTDSEYTAVVAFVRKPTGLKDAKLTEHVIDLSNLEQHKHLVVGDVAFSCLGTTLKAAGSKENQWKIDFDIPAAFARIAKANQVNAFVLVSSADAAATSKLFYSRMKGQLEELISALHFKQYVIFKPGLLLRDGSDRLAEKIGVRLVGWFNAIGLFSKFKPLPTQLLAEKLAKAPKVLPSGVTTIKLQGIFEF
jgi:uncharacterized protein YbjT (DUF2867 family)